MHCTGVGNRKMSLLCIQAYYFPTFDSSHSAVRPQSCAMLSSTVKINLVTYFEDVGADVYQWMCKLPVEVISMDFTRGDSLQLLRTHGFPTGKILGAGVIDARSPWALEPTKVMTFTSHSMFTCMEPQGHRNGRLCRTFFP